MSIVRKGSPANQLSEAVRGCLGDAEAQATRHYGDAPVALWHPRPRSRRRRWLACIAVVLTCSVGAWRLGADERAGASVVVVAEPATQHASMDSAGAQPDTVEATDAWTQKRQTTTPGAFNPAAAPARMPPAVEPSHASVVDADAWALHPEPRPTAVLPPESFTGLVNVPDVPDEQDATPGEDTLPEEHSVVDE